ncbi:right-handed parallel beta-helix repeat-containing protein [candidate division CSSED10-310 bacterium]|uniref:Right-handed parallel beta-helix repeat-containing protein n=1 Tax=candidate division CSSED10-310 bacterium TaxID=2855610 RepID=A0ABV6Z5W4_UNCC1
MVIFRGFVIFGTIILVALHFLASPSLAETFNVSDVSSLQTALNSAAVNGEDDVISIAAITLAVNSTLTYNSAETFSLTISGDEISDTILDGGNTNQIMILSATGSGAALIVQDLIFRKGSNTNSGGGALQANANSGSVTITRCEFNNNQASGNDGIGGGLNVLSDYGSIQISDSFFRYNSSLTNVGGLYAGTVSGSVSLSASLFEGNTVNNQSTHEHYGDGGGAMIYADAGSSVTVTGCTFQNNSCTGGITPDGGGLMIYQQGATVEATVEGNTFTLNQASLGGGGLFARISDSGTIQLNQNQFTSNTTVTGDGAGAYLDLNSATVTVTDNSWTGNNAASAGGGMWLTVQSGSGTIQANTFTSNGAGTMGGGLHLATDAATFTVTRNIFDSNQATDIGGGINYATTNATWNMLHNTLYNNSASEGSGIYIYFDQNDAVLNLRNLILWANPSDELAFSSGTGTGTLTVYYSDVKDGTGQPWFGPGCISDSPLFAAAASRDFKLTWTNFPVVDETQSPCIDSGDPASPLDPDATRADMGAIPFDQSLVVPAMSGFTLGLILVGLSLVFRCFGKRPST